ncbi:hypothetical protein F5Y15DRAFT_230969 [Xylariaceae sp. FL0016]|nr:hypothetical protein F5Y15DRAFT_230969 [Xylariaceae sp. FL0016]
MSITPGKPRLSIVNKYDRKYGRYDSHRFDHVVAQHASVGATSLGKIHVDCRFLFEKSKWGVLEEDEPAGIIYLDLTFSQPDDCRLKSAMVQVTLDDEDPNLLQQYPGLRSKPVQIVKYGPRQMSGNPQYEYITVRDSFMPSIDVGPFGGAGGVGRETQKMVARESRWKFESHLMTGSETRRKRGNNSWAYKVLQWHLTENELETQSNHSNIVHTAFSFVHSGQPLLMRVEVSGRLESKRSHMNHVLKHGFRKLRFPANPYNSGFATTLINFDGRKNFTAPLDRQSEDLELAMVQENLSAPIEVPQSQQNMLHEENAEQRAVPNTLPSTLEDQLNAVSDQATTVPIDDTMTTGQGNHSGPTISDLAYLSTTLMFSSKRELTSVPNVGGHAPIDSKFRSRAQDDEAIKTTENQQATDETMKELGMTDSSKGFENRVPNDVAFKGLVFLITVWILEKLVMIIDYRGQA